jgi:hypothetical protein
VRGGEGASSVYLGRLFHVKQLLTRQSLKTRVNTYGHPETGDYICLLGMCLSLHIFTIKLGKTLMVKIKKIGTIESSATHEDTMKKSILDYILAIAIGLCLTMAALAYFDILTK